MLGLYVSRPPADGGRGGAAPAPTAPSTSSSEVEDGSRAHGGRRRHRLQRKWTKKGDLMAVFILEDLQGSIEVMVFPKTMPRSATCWPTTRW